MTVNGNEIWTTRERLVYRDFRNWGSPLRKVPLYLKLTIIIHCSRLFSPT